MESKAELRKRLKREGRWEEFTELREQLKLSGRKQEEAHKETAELFAPLAGGSAADGEAVAPPYAESLAAGAVSRMMQLEAAYRALAGQVDPSRQAKTQEITQWCFQHYLVEPAAIDPASVPSAGALGLLLWLQTSSSHYTDFIKTVWSKMLPSRQQVETADRFQDDGREHFEYLDQFDEQFGAQLAVDAGAEERAGQHRVPA